MDAYPKSLDRPPSVVILSEDEDDDNHRKKSTVPTRSMKTRLPSTPPRQRRRSQPNVPRDIEMVDLTTPNQSPVGLSQTFPYVPRTLHEYNQQRLTILPAYISMVDRLDASNLLLANVPAQQLSSQELKRRQSGMYPCAFKVNPNSASTTSVMIKEYEKYFATIVDRLKVDLSILDYNYTRLNSFLELYRSIRQRILPKEKCSSEQSVLNDNELPLLLELYLQMDVDLFYWKTYSLNEVQPRSANEGIFCLTLPTCRYTMSPCGHCNLCEQKSIVFNRFGKHTFVNGYESILNAPATCQTKNFIYALTCYCNQADYISETKYTLSTRLQGHRSLGHHLIRRHLIGAKNLQYFETNENLPTIPFLNKASMLLYQHLIRCSTAIQRFLDDNPRYWRFVPMKLADANQDDINYPMSSTTTAAAAAPTTTTMASSNSMPTYFPDQFTQVFLSNVPKPPMGYAFSKRQVNKQIEFFKTKLIREPINDRTDFFQSEIIAVLPPNSSDLFRQIVHSLFVIHTESQLNTLGHVFDYPLNRTSAREESFWCAHLQRRSTSTFCSYDT